MNKPKVICVMGKSGSGKSTLINEIVKQFENYYSIKSYTTRKPRKNDPEDIKTHKFVIKECLDRDEENKQVVSKYHSDKGYYSWTTHSCFNENKINLYAIDPPACLKFIEEYSDKYDIYPVYIYVDKKIRLERLKKRDNIEELPEEYHLSLDQLEEFIKKNIEFGIVVSTEDKKENFNNFINKINKMIIYKDYD